MALGIGFLPDDGFEFCRCIRHSGSDAGDPGPRMEALQARLSDDGHHF
jgi:hypothetical protein